MNAHYYGDSCVPPHNSPRTAWLAERLRRARVEVGGRRRWRQLDNADRDAVLSLIDSPTHCPDHGMGWEGPHGLGCGCSPAWDRQPKIGATR